MKHLLLTTVAAVILTAGCAFRPAQKTDQNAALNMGLVEHDVVYRIAGDKNLRLNVYLPDEFIGEPPWWTNDGKGKKPTLLYIHGGGWVVGSKDERVLNVLPYVYRDWVVISINYRLAKDAKAPAAVGDCLIALEWIYANADKYDIDTDRIVVSGGSAGGHLALLTGMLREGDQLCGGKLKVENTRKVAAIVNWYGVTDFTINPDNDPDGVVIDFYYTRVYDQSGLGQTHGKAEDCSCWSARIQQGWPSANQVYAPKNPTFSVFHFCDLLPC